MVFLMRMEVKVLEIHSRFAHGNEQNEQYKTRHRQSAPIHCHRSASARHHGAEFGSVGRNLLAVVAIGRIFLD